MKANIRTWSRWAPLFIVLLMITALIPRFIVAQENPSSVGQNILHTELTEKSTPQQHFSQKKSPGAEPVALARVSQPAEELTNKQGDVSIKVSLPAVVNAGDDILYTYSYTNTSDSDVSDITIEVKWVNFALEATTESNIYQYCVSDCTVQDGSVTGPDVTVEEAVNSNGTGLFAIGTLTTGESGSFSILLRSNRITYPQTNKTIVRPSGSARLFVGNSTDPMSENTNNTMVVGPVLSVSKEAITTGSVYPLRNAQFQLHIGNATGSGDVVVDGSIRADARNANNIEVTDYIPSGSEFVSASDNYVLDTENNAVVWTIEGPLVPGETVDLDVTYRKLDEAEACGTILNNNYSVTSEEMPFKEGDSGDRYSIAGTQKASISVVDPIRIISVSESPAKIPYTNESTIAIKVQSSYDTAIQGVQVEYELPTDVSYISADPPMTTAPDGTQQGGTATWTFNMPAASIDEPTTQVLNVTVKGSFTNNGSVGKATVTVPETIPSACVKSSNGRGIALEPRLSYTPYVSGDDQFDQLVMRGDAVTYKIDITNTSDNDATGVSITDEMPGEAIKKACFSYIPDTALFGESYLEPTIDTTLGCGTLTWDNMTIPANSTITLSYQLQADGHFYTYYYNKTTVSSEQEAVTKSGKENWIKINPNIEISKEVNKSNVGPGDQVAFTLKIANNEAVSYTVGLQDNLGKFFFDDQQEGFAVPVLVGNNGESAVLAWELTPIEPEQELKVVFNAHVPDGCYNTVTLENELLFTIDSYGETLLVEPIPNEKVGVKVTKPESCIPATPTPTPILTPTPTSTPDPNIPTPTPAPKVLEYSMQVDRTNISLRDRHTYTLLIRNTNPQVDVTDVVVENILPEGFVFVENHSDSDIQLRPTIEKTESNETRMTWNVDAIAAGDTITIKFIAISSEVVGQYMSTMEVRPSADWKANSKGSTSILLMVSPLITISPSISGENVNTDCYGQEEDLTYKLVFLNTNTHDYISTTAVISLPIGIQYLGPSKSTITPTRNLNNNDGSTVIIWEDLLIPKKSSGQAFSQVSLELKLRVGNTWKTMKTIVESTSPDGLIPRKEDAEEAIVNVCLPDKASFSKDTNAVDIWKDKDDEYVLFEILLANPLPTDIVGVVLQDVLPKGMVFSNMVGDDPLLNPTVVTETNTLQWTGISVPPSVDSNMGYRKLQYRAKIEDWEHEKVYQNVAEVIAPEDTFDTITSSAKIILSQPPTPTPTVTPTPISFIEGYPTLYLPIIQYTQK